MFWLILCGALLVALMYMLVFALLKAADDEEANVLHFREDIPMTVTTPVPAPTAWAKYPVPLDDELQQYIAAQCREKDVDPSIVFAVIGVESQYRADAIGDHGNSFGLMQIYRACHEDRMERLGVTDLLDPYQNVTVGIDILAEILSWGNGMEWALSYYHGNGGAPDEYAHTVLCNAEQILEGVMVTPK